MGLPWFVPKLWFPTRGLLGYCGNSTTNPPFGDGFYLFYNPFILVYHSTLCSDKPQSQSSWISRDPQSWTSIPTKLSVPLPGEYGCAHPWRYDQKVVGCSHRRRGLLRDTSCKYTAGCLKLMNVWTSLDSSVCSSRSNGYTSLTNHVPTAWDFPPCFRADPSSPSGLRLFLLFSSLYLGQSVSPKKNPDLKLLMVAKSPPKGCLFTHVINHGINHQQDFAMASTVGL